MPLTNLKFSKFLYFHLYFMVTSMQLIQLKTNDLIFDNFLKYFLLNY